MENINDTSSQDNQSMLARYNRAAAWGKKAFSENMELHARVFPNWIGDGHRFWYERIHKTATEFRLVDAKAATNSNAFDHEKLAVALEDKTGYKVAANALPISNLDFSGVSFTFDAFGKSWELDGETS